MDGVLSYRFLFVQSDNIVDAVIAIRFANKLQKFSNEVSNALLRLRSAILVDGELSLALSEPSSLKVLHSVLDLLFELKDNEAAKDLKSDLSDKIFALLPGGDGDVTSDPTLIFPLSRLSDKKLRIEKNALKVSAEQLINSKFATDAQTLYNAFKSLEVVQKYKAAPFHAALKQKTLQHGEAMTLEAEVVDVLGNNVEVEEIEIVSLKVIGKDSFVAQNLKEKGSKVTVPADNLSVGRYGVSVSVTLAPKQATSKFQTFVVVQESAKVESVGIAVSDSKKAAGDLTSVKSQNSLSGISASASAQDVIHVSFKVSGKGGEGVKRPHQAFVRFTNIETSLSAVYSASKVSDSSSLEFHAAVALGEETEIFDFQSGQYLVSILVADSAIAQPVEWILGSIDLVFPGRQSVNLPLYAKSLLHTSDTTLKALPEIEHQMRPPAKQASNFMAATFTALTLVPLLAFIIFNLGLKPNFAKLNSIWSIAFVVLLGSIFALYYGYWLALEGVSFYDTIKYLFILLPVTILAGKYSLSAVATARLVKEKSA